MHIWPESEGGRGSEDVASCLYRYVTEEVGDEVNNVIAYSDTCGQNRNVNIASMWLYVVHTSGNVDVVDHKSMYSGHSFLPNDREYGSIEQKKRNVGAVYVPKQWCELVKSARRKKPFIVKEMERHHFKSFSPVRAQMTNRKRNTNGDKVGWLKIQWMRFQKEHPWEMQYKHSHSELEPWKTVSFKKNARGRPADLRKVQPSLLHVEVRQITKAKFDDLMSLLAYIPPVHHGFYLTVKPGDVPLEENLHMSDEEEDKEALVLQKLQCRVLLTILQN